MAATLHPAGSRVFIYDTTLRDGEQAPGYSMAPDQKVEIGLALEEAGVDVIEAGFPASSDDDLTACRRLAGALARTTLAVLARARPADLLVCSRAVAGAARSRIHVFSPVSDIHIAHKLRSDRMTVLRSVREGVRLASDMADEVQFGCEDATRADEDFVAEAVSEAIDSGATTVTLADTVGYAMPEEFAGLVGRTIGRCGKPGVRFAVHCHNDLGLALANSLAGLKAGARQLECTILGIGERAGNAALEEAGMALIVRENHFRLRHGLHCERLWSLSRTLAAAIDIPVVRHKAVVGDNAFAHESGIHQHGVIAAPVTYEIMNPADVGAPDRRLVIGKHSGRHGVAARLAILGYAVDEATLGEVLACCKAESLPDGIEDARLAQIVASVQEALTRAGETSGAESQRTGGRREEQANASI